VTWQLKPFDALTPYELYAIMAVRQRVFVVEQRCAYLDADGYDARALHLWYAPYDTAPIDAYLRAFGPGVKYPECSLGRVVTSPEARRTGLGKTLVARGLDALRSHHGDVPVRISAQQYLERFYGAFGFVRVGDDYLEDDIPHCEMLRPAR
jgi:ElaA protein